MKLINLFLFLPILISSQIKFEKNIFEYDKSGLLQVYNVSTYTFQKETTMTIKQSTYDLIVKNKYLGLTELKDLNFEFARQIILISGDTIKCSYFPESYAINAKERYKKINLKPGCVLTLRTLVFRRAETRVNVFGDSDFCSSDSLVSKAILTLYHSSMLNRYSIDFYLEPYIKIK